VHVLQKVRDQAKLFQPPSHFGLGLFIRDCAALVYGTSAMGNAVEQIHLGLKFFVAI
jgi:hypothetical protein